MATSWSRSTSTLRLHKARCDTTNLSDFVRWASTTQPDPGTSRSVSRRKPHPPKPGPGFLGSRPRRLEPTFLNGNPGFRNAFLSCLGSLRVPKAGRSPLGKRPRRAARSRVTRSRHKRPPPPSTLRSRGPLHLFRFAAARS